MTSFATFLNVKHALFLLFCLSLSSCNTAIGLYRDAKQGVIWTKKQIQERSGGSSDPYGAPTY